VYFLRKRKKSKRIHLFLDVIKVIEIPKFLVFIDSTQKLAEAVVRKYLEK